MQNVDEPTPLKPVGGWRDQPDSDDDHSDDDHAPPVNIYVKILRVRLSVRPGPSVRLSICPFV